MLPPPPPLSDLLLLRKDREKKIQKESSLKRINTDLLQFFVGGIFFRPILLLTEKKYLDAPIVASE